MSVLLSTPPASLWATSAVVTVWAVVAVAIRLCEPDRPLLRLRDELVVVRDPAIITLRWLDRQAATALVVIGRVTAAALVVTLRAAAVAIAVTVRFGLRAAVLAVVATTRLTAAVAVLAVTALLAASLIAPTASALAGAVHVGNPSPSEDAVTLAPLAQRSTVRAADGTEIAVLHGEFNRRVVDLDAIPPLLRAAVITAEDRDFPEHDGFDEVGIARAAWTNVSRGGIVEGGSTITQQVAKANFTNGERTLARKLTELRFARALEGGLGKAAILERYLNEVYVGRGAYGMAAGAEAFFGRDPAHLETHQAALLAGMIAAPGRFDPDRAPVLARVRRNQVLAGMAAEGYVTERHAELAANRGLDTVPRHAATPTDPFVVEQVKRELLADPALGDTVAERIDALFAGGLTIHTSVDPRLQAVADDLVSDALADAGPTAAMVLLDAATGEIAVTHSGQSFDVDQYDPALQGRRQPGSAFKTFVLVAALEQGRSLADPVDATSPAVLEFGGVRPWRVRNYAGASLGTLPLSEAFARSSNTAFARLMLEVGQPAVEDVLARLGIDVDRALGAQRGLSPAMALGGVAHGMTLPEMASAFAALAGDGRLARPHVVTAVTDADGRTLLEREPDRRRAVSREVAAATRTALRGVVESGTGRRAAIPGREVVGKTGTSQRFADAWFVGEVDGLAAAVWVGHPQGRVPMAGMTGGQLPAELWRGIVGAALDAPGAGR